MRERAISEPPPIPNDTFQRVCAWAADANPRKIRRSALLTVPPA